MANNQNARDQSRERSIAVALLALAWLLETAHLTVLTVAPHPVLLSNVVQLLSLGLAGALCLRKAYCAVERRERFSWKGLTLAFALSFLAQCYYLGTLFHLHLFWLSYHPDDALWLLFGLPIVGIVLFAQERKRDLIAVLDTSQALLFFSILYISVFVPHGHLRFSTAFNVQDAALVLCCLLRLPNCTFRTERRFYRDLNLFLIAYGLCTAGGYILYDRGYPAGSFVDLAWTMPVCLYIALIARPQSAGMNCIFDRFLNATQDTSGTMVTILTTMSLTESALLAQKHLLMGCVCGVASFTVAALRNNFVERIWRTSQLRMEAALLHDSLTGLGNRAMLRLELGERMSHPNRADRTTLTLVDIDGFQNFNNSIGHAAGDDLLKSIGHRLRSSMPPDAAVYRLGGDKFVVLTSSDNPATAANDARLIKAVFQKPLPAAGFELCCTASLGVVLAKGISCFDDLLRAAERGVRQSKRSREDQIQIFDTSLLPEMQRRWQMAGDLRTSVDTGGIDIVYQPIVCVSTLTISGVEALARWCHPQYGPISPSEFISLAEDAGLIASIGRQVLKKASRQVAEWNQDFGARLRLNVNVSPRQFASSKLLVETMEILEQAALSPELLTMEITKSAFLVQKELVKETLVSMRSLGICIALDDFGTGYSSLSFLRDLPADEVKIDRSFVAEMDRDARCELLVRTTIELAHAFGKRVVAEGVEHAVDLNRLEQMNCDYAQGWFFSRPLTAQQCVTALPVLLGSRLLSGPVLATETQASSAVV